MFPLERTPNERRPNRYRIQYPYLFSYKNVFVNISSSQYLAIGTSGCV